MYKRKAHMGLAFLAAACGFAFALGERQAEALVPNPCPKQDCANLYAWWNGTTPAGKGCSAAHKLGTTDFKDTSTYDSRGIPNVYADTGSPGDVVKQLKDENGNDVEQTLVEFPTHDPGCGKHANGLWQTPQRVSPSGTATNPKNVKKVTCQPSSTRL